LGRPSKFPSEDKLPFIRKMVELGATDKDIAEACGVTEQTINNYKQSHPDFFESLKSWKETADGKVERSLYQRAIGYSHTETKAFNQQGEIITADILKHYPPDPTSCIFWLKNRMPGEWREKVSHVSATEDDVIPNRIEIVVKDSSGDNKSES